MGCVAEPVGAPDFVYFELTPSRRRSNKAATGMILPAAWGGSFNKAVAGGSASFEMGRRTQISARGPRGLPRGLSFFSVRPASYSLGIALAPASLTSGGACGRRRDRGDAIRERAAAPLGAGGAPPRGSRAG